MKKFTITGIAAGDVANLTSVYVKADGENIIVTGQNGAGKSTIAKTILWTLMGGTADGEKLIPATGGGLPYAEIEVTDGTVYTKFRKEMIQKVDARGKMSRTTDCFINGLPVTLKDFQEYFSRYVTPEVFQILIGLGNFFKLKTDTQRAILTENFSEVDDKNILADAEFSKLKTTDANQIKMLKKRLETDLKTIPAKIETLASQMKDVEDNRKILEEEIAALESEYAEVTKIFTLSQDTVKKIETPREKLRQAKFEMKTLESDYSAGNQKINSDKARLDQLRGDYENVADTCPTCGQNIQGQHVAKIREKIAVEGKNLAEQIKRDEEKLQEIIKRGKTLRQEIKTLEEEVQAQNYDTSELDSAAKRMKTLRDEISKRQAVIAKLTAQIELNAENQRRIEELLKQEKSLGQQLTECEFQVDLIGKFIRRKMNLVTDSINEHFQFVKFKMFETLKNGEVKNICEATLHGVPYNQLSKGEKFKVALDLLNTLQNFYGVMFPLIIDDAESYTSNSLIEIPNQQIILRAVEGQAELQISGGDIERRSVA